MPTARQVLVDIAHQFYRERYEQQSADDPEHDSEHYVRYLEDDARADERIDRWFTERHPEDDPDREVTPGSCPGCGHSHDPNADA